MITAHDVGTIINPVDSQGQIDGATIMGIGQGIMEELIMKMAGSTITIWVTTSFQRKADIPMLKTVLVKSDGGVGPINAKPIGEFANNGPPAAIANAIADAVGDAPVRAAAHRGKNLYLLKIKPQSAMSDLITQAPKSDTAGLTSSTVELYSSRRIVVSNPLIEAITMGTRCIRESKVALQRNRKVVAIEVTG